MGVFNRRHRLRWEIAATLLIKLIAIICISRLLFGPSSKLDPEPSTVGQHLFGAGIHWQAPDPGHRGEKP